MFDKILVAIDYSPMHRDVFQQALTIAKASNADLMLFHALWEQEEGYPTFPVYYSHLEPAVNAINHKQYQEQWIAFEERGRDMLEQLTQEANNLGLQAEFSQVSGNPSRAICNLAQTWEADLIVVGRRGYSGIKEIFLGSVSNYVTHHAPCSVLVVQDAAQQKSEP